MGEISTTLTGDSSSLVAAIEAASNAFDGIAAKYAEIQAELDKGFKAGSGGAASGAGFDKMAEQAEAAASTVRSSVAGINESVSQLGAGAEAAAAKLGAIRDAGAGLAGTADALKAIGDAGAAAGDGLKAAASGSGSLARSLGRIEGSADGAAAGVRSVADAGAGLAAAADGAKAVADANKAIADSAVKATVAQDRQATSAKRARDTTAGSAAVFDAAAFEASMKDADAQLEASRRRIAASGADTSLARARSDAVLADAAPLLATSSVEQDAALRRKKLLAGAGAAASAETPKWVKDTLLGGGIAAAYGIDKAMKYQSQMMLLHTQAGVSMPDTRAMQQGVLKIAGQTGISQSDAAESAYHVASNMASLGTSVPQMLQAVKVAAEGARMGHADPVDVTNALTAEIASGMKGVKGYGGAMGALNATVGSGDMSMQDLAGAFSTGILANVKSYGVTLPDVGAGLATLGDNNIRGTKAGTDLRMAVQYLGSPGTGPVAQDALEKLHLKYDSLQKDMQKGGLKLAIDDLDSHMRKAGFTGDKVGSVLTDAFGKKAGPALAILTEQQRRFLSKYPELIDGANKFGSAWDATNATPAQKWAELKSSSQSLVTNFGETLLPTFTKATGFADGLLDKINSSKTGTDALAIGIGGLAAAVTTKKLFSGVESAASTLGKLGRTFSIPGLNKLGSAETGNLSGAAADLSGAAAELSGAAGKLSESSITRGAAKANSMGASAAAGAAAAEEETAKGGGFLASAKAVGMKGIGGLIAGAMTASIAIPLDQQLNHWISHKMGKSSTAGGWATVGSSALTGGVIGASAGMVAGPTGAMVGGILGAITGAVVQSMHSKPVQSQMQHYYQNLFHGNEKAKPAKHPGLPGKPQPDSLPTGGHPAKHATALNHAAKFGKSHGTWAYHQLMNDVHHTGHALDDVGSAMSSALDHSQHYTANHFDWARHQTAHVADTGIGWAKDLLKGPAALQSWGNLGHFGAHVFDDARHAVASAGHGTAATFDSVRHGAARAADSAVHGIGSFLFGSKPQATVRPSGRGFGVGTQITPGKEGLFGHLEGGLGSLLGGGKKLSLSSLFSGGKADLGKLLGGGKSANPFQSLTKDAEQAAKSAQQAFKGVGKSLTSDLGGKGGSNPFKSLDQQAKQAAKNAQTDFKSVGKGLKADLGGGSGGNPFKSLGQEAQQAAKQAGNSFKTVGKDITSSLSGKGGNPFQALGQEAQAAAKQAASAFKSVGSSISSALAGVNGSSAFHSIVSGAQQAARQAGSAFKSVPSEVSSAMSGVSSAVSAGMSKAASAARSGSSQIAGAFSGLSGKLEAAGQAAMAGLAAGIQAGEGAAVAAAASAAAAVSAAAKVTLGIASPSKVFKGIGKDTIAGLVQGLQGGKQEIATAANDIKTQVTKPFTDKTIAGTITKLEKDVAAALKSKTVSKPEDSDLVKSLKTDNSKLMALAKQRSSLESQISAAKSYASNVTSNTSQAYDLSSIAGTVQTNLANQTSPYAGVTPSTTLTTSNLLGGYKQSVQQIQQFTTKIEQLKKAGLNKTTLGQLIQAGPQSGLPMAKAIESGGKGAIAQFNKLQGQLTSSATKLGTVSGNAMYEAGSDVGKGLAQGLKSQLSSVTQTMQQMATTIVNTVKSALKIHSPSLVFHDIGVNVVDGMALGIEHSAASAAASAGKMAAGAASAAGGGGSHLSSHPAMAAGGGSPGGGGGDGGGSVHIENHHWHIAGSVLSEGDLHKRFQQRTLQRASNNLGSGQKLRGRAA